MSLLKGVDAVHDLLDRVHLCSIPAWMFPRPFIEAIPLTSSTPGAGG